MQIMYAYGVGQKVNSLFHSYGVYNTSMQENNYFYIYFDIFMNINV